MRAARRVPLLLVLLLALVAPLPAAARGAMGPVIGGYPTQASTLPKPFDFTALDRVAPAVARLAAALAHLPPLAQLEAVNARVNAVPAGEDDDLWGVADRWAAPQDFFRRGGDCEDYAIAKYAVLERLGWSSRRMWITVMRETVISPIHAVLLVEHDGALWTLDNLASRVFPQGAVDFYRPAWSVNRFGRWEHGAPAALAIDWRGTGRRRPDPPGGRPPAAPRAGAP